MQITINVKFENLKDLKDILRIIDDIDKEHRCHCTLNLVKVKNESISAQDVAKKIGEQITKAVENSKV